MNVGAGQVGQDFGQTGAFRSHLPRPALAEQDFGQTGAFRSHLPRPALAEQDFGQTGAFRSHLSRPALAETEGVKGVRQAGIRLNRLTRMVARLSHPYHGF